MGRAIYDADLDQRHRMEAMQLASSWLSRLEV